MKKYIFICAIASVLSLTTSCSAAPPPTYGVSAHQVGKDQISTPLAAPYAVELTALEPTTYHLAVVMDAPVDVAGILPNIETGTVALKAKTTVAASSDGYCYQRAPANKSHWLLKILVLYNRRDGHIDPGLLT